jgi:hypothetical protein
MRLMRLPRKKSAVTVSAALPRGQSLKQNRLDDVDAGLTDVEYRGALKLVVLEHVERAIGLGKTDP